MMMFGFGFVAAIVVLILLSRFALNYAVKKGWYASAIWNEKEKVWKVRGRYLSIAGKIFDGIQNKRAGEPGSVKYLD
ncbi:hypothetical protein [Escherichia phage vB_EcoS_PHB17]|uniref:Uncharacterized protein n=1 Tax=Escherichia phage vB_EcoS_PHB17 TaxID=2591407 RepID=A0A514DKN3_9CAUD|nr:hypothetical protein KMB84_gp27 [Escherichia phage vB_EcoS_PHB17]QDH94230.1 hypothetical protein [Escherichia phage vB_EcoS_PHB17]